MRRLFRLQKCIVVLVGASFMLCMILGIGVLSSKDLSGGLIDRFRVQKNQIIEQTKKVKDFQHPTPAVVQTQLEDGKQKEPYFPDPNYNLHAFYYPWYGNPQFDEQYYHWNHPYLPHWSKNEARKWPTGRHTPPASIGSNFYPQLGPYSSRDPAVIDNHMQQLRDAAIGVLAVSWYPPLLADDNGKPWEDLMPTLLDAAQKYKLKVCFHLEPYKKRTHKTVRNDIALIVSKYGRHPAFYKHTWHGKELPLYYIYDSYLISRDAWGALFRPDGALSLRGTPQDGLFIGLLVEERHQGELVVSGFDGFYTYFASDGFSHGASTRNWGALAAYAATNNMLFVPSAGPGYVDVRVRPWNARNTKERENGGYYEQSMKAAVAASPSVISITSFNEWHEGTQIEKAVPHTSDDGFTYRDYKPMAPGYYLELTRKWSFRYKQLLRTR